MSRRAQLVVGTHAGFWTSIAAATRDFPSALTPMESERPDERISAARRSPFLTAADGNRDAALDLGGDVNL